MTLPCRHAATASTLGQNHDSYNPLTIPIPTQDLHSVFCPQDYRASWIRVMSAAEGSIPSPDYEQPCCSYTLYTTVPPTSPAASSAKNTSSAVKRKIEEVESPQETRGPHRKCLKKTKHLTYPLTPESSPRATSPSSVEIDSEEEAARCFDPQTCLEALFGCSLSSPNTSEEDPVSTFNPESCASALFSLAGRAILTCPSNKRPRSLPKRKGRTSASCSRKITNTGGFLTSHHMYQCWNTAFLKKLQKELYRAQQRAANQPISRITSSISQISPPIRKPIIYTSVKKCMPRKFDWDKLQSSLSYLSVTGGGTIGHESAKHVIQRMSMLCRQKKMFSQKLTAISGGTLTRWCAEALLDQKIRVTQELLNPPTTHRLGHQRFISGEQDIAAAHKNLDAFLNTHRALSLLCRGEPIQNTSPITSPTTSDDSDTDS